MNTVNTTSHGQTLEVSTVKKRAFAKPPVNRKHLRLILDEVGKRIDELRDFGPVYESLIGASRGKLSVGQMQFFSDYGHSSASSSSDGNRSS